jgi:hypothetical protein
MECMHNVNTPMAPTNWEVTGAIDLITSEVGYPWKVIVTLRLAA